MKVYASKEQYLSEHKDIEKSLAGFDQINKLTEPTDDSSDSSGSTGGTSSGIGSVDLVPDVSGSTSINSLTIKI